MKCTQARQLFSLYLDGALTGRQMQALGAHLEDCDACQRQYTQLRQTQQLLASVRRPQVPPDLNLKLRVAVSQEIARRRHRWLEATLVELRTGIGHFMVPATAGLVTAIAVFVVLMGSFALPVQAANDVPLMMYVPPAFKASAYTLQQGEIREDSVVVEAYIDEAGRVEDFRVLSSPRDVQQWLPQVKNALVFTEFQPALAMGRPTPGRVVLAFTRSRLDRIQRIGKTGI